MNNGNILQAQRRTLTIDPHRNRVKIINRLDITTAAHHVLGLGHLDQPSAHIPIRILDRSLDFGQRQTKALQCVGIHLDLILFYVTTH